MVYFNVRKLLLLLFTLQINSFNLNNCNNIKIVNNNNKQNKIIMKYQLCPIYLEKFTKFLDDSQGEVIVKQISGVFPKMDIISHFVLHTNDVLINYVLNNIIPGASTFDLL